MKHALIFIFFLFSFGLFGQGTPTIKLTQLEKGKVGASPAGGLIGVTRSSDGKQRYMTYVNVADVCINYSPTPTGNLLNLNNFVQKCATDSIWYIDYEGRSIFLGRTSGGGLGVSDHDWLTIPGAYIPDSIGQPIFTYNKASIGANYNWPGAELLVNDSTGSAVAIAQGNRIGGWAVYNKINGSWTRFGHDGNLSLITADPTAQKLFIQSAGSGTVQAPGAPFTTRMEVDFTTGGIRFNAYPNTRNDAGIPVNVLTTDAIGELRSHPVTEIVPTTFDAADVVYNPTAPLTATDVQSALDEAALLIEGGGGGGGSLPLNQVGYGNGSSIISDTNLLRIQGSNDLILKGVNANLSLKTMDTTGIVTINESSQLSEKPRLVMKGNGGYGLVFENDSRKSTYCIQPFYINRSFFGSVSPSGDNQVFNMGINYSPVGGLVNRYSSAVGIAFENNFKNDPLELGNPGLGFFEMQFPEVIYSDTIIGNGGIKYATGVPFGTKRRMIAGYASNEKPSNGGNFAFTTDFMNIFDWKTATQRFVWGFSDGSDKGMYFLDTADIKFNINNTTLLTQRNSGGTGFIDVLKVNNLNEIELSPSGNPLFTRATSLTSSNSLTIAAGAGQNLIFGTTTGTARLDVRGIAAVPLTVSSSLNTDGYGFRVDNFTFGLRDLSTNRDVLSYDKGSPAQSMWIRNNGNIGFGAYPAFDAALHINRATLAKTSTMIRMTNISGSSSQFRTDATPDGSITAQPGDIAQVNIFGVGGFYTKVSGSGNTGWEKNQTGLETVSLNSSVHVGSVVTPGVYNIGWIRVPAAYNGYKLIECNISVRGAPGAASSIDVRGRIDGVPTPTGTISTGETTAQTIPGGGGVNVTTGQLLQLEVVTITGANQPTDLAIVWILQKQ
ncbi:MAG: hypothetical protein ACRC78_04145 [Planktothrix sp.]